MKRITCVIAWTSGLVAQFNGVSHKRQARVEHDFLQTSDREEQGAIGSCCRKDKFPKRRDAIVIKVKVDDDGNGRKQGQSSRQQQPSSDNKQGLPPSRVVKKGAEKDVRASRSAAAIEVVAGGGGDSDI